MKRMLSELPENTPAASCNDGRLPGAPTSVNASCNDGRLAGAPTSAYVSFNDGRLPGAPTSAAALFNEGRLPDAPTERRSVRLADYDYSQAGWYFVTIMAQGRQPVFGNINADAVLEPSLAGQVVAACWHQLGSAYPSVHLDVWQLMPDHVHFVLGLLPNSRKPKPLGQLVGAFKASATRGVRAGAARYSRSLAAQLLRAYYSEC